MSFESQIYGMMSNIVRFLKSQPINLGGYSSANGGAGGPPGGFIGYLPQGRVAYDETEASTDVTPSGATLVDNLNHIRYRIDTIESSGGIRVEENNVVVASGVTIVNFEDDFSISDDGGGQVTITLFSGTTETSLSGIYGEDLTSQTPETHFSTQYEFYPNSLEVYYNGIRQSETYFTQDENYSGFTMTFAVPSGDTVLVDYQAVVSGNIRHTHSQYALETTFSGYYTKSEVNNLWAVTAPIDHTHVEDDITDLSHDAVKIQGVSVDTALPIDGQALAYDALLGKYTPTTISGSGGGSSTISVWCPYAPPASGTSYDDEFSNSSFNSSLWTEYDPGNCLTILEDDRGLVFTQDMTNGYKVAGIYQPIPSGDFTITTKTDALTRQLDFTDTGIGLALWEDATDSSKKIYTWELDVRSDDHTAQLMQWTNYTTRAGLVTNYTGVITTSLYLRIRRSGANYSFDWSHDGIGWIMLDPPTVADRTLSFTPTSFGITLYNSIGAYKIGSIGAITSFFRYNASDVGISGTLYGRRVGLVI